MSSRSLSSPNSFVVLNSGNITSTLAKLPNQTPATVEITAAIANSIQILSNKEVSDAFNARISQDKESFVPRELLQVTAKLFFNESIASSEQATQQIDTALSHSFKAMPYAHSLDLFVVNISHSCHGASTFKYIWQYLESLVDKNLVKSLGVSDFSESELKDLMSYARIAPSVNQISLEDASGPNGAAMMAFAKANGIELRTLLAGDSNVSLSSIDLSSIASSDQHWSVSWALRYTVTAKHQHLLLTKGYLVGCESTDASAKNPSAMAANVASRSVLVSH